MIVWLLIVLTALAQVAAPSVPTGTIEGIVVNGSRNDEPVGGAEVLLRAGQDNHFESNDRAKCDRSGQFTFCVPLDPQLVYLAGADRDGIHYPGKRIQFDERHPVQRVMIRVFDAINSPSPLTASRHEIDVNVDGSVMTIHETLVINNKSLSTYVGERLGDEAPVTLRLCIPSNFDRVTFAEEFYGRRFQIADHQLLTDIPWPPGQRELSFTYRVPLEGSGGQFRRLVDLPCDQVVMRILGSHSKHATCNLPCAEQGPDRAVFASKGKQISIDDVIQAQITATPFPWMQSLRWGSLLMLLALISATAYVRKMRGPGATSQGQRLSARRAA